MESEGQIGPDGTVEVTIDSSAAKDLHGDMDHKYEVSAEVTDQSRRTITGNGTVLAAREPYQVHVWVNSGYYRAGDTVKAEFSAQTLDGKPVKGLGKVSLYQVNYVEKEGDLTPQEKEVGTWKVQMNDEGHASLQMKAAQAGQYRMACKVTDEADHVVDGAYVFNVVGENFRSEDFRFNEIELIPDKKEYASGEKMRLLINANQKNATVYLFVRPLNGQYEAPRVLRLKGKSAVEEVVVGKGDVPSFFIEAFTVHEGRLHSEMREIAVPPESRILNMTVEPSKKEYKPGEKGTAKIRLTDAQGKPVAAQVVLTMYDRALEYISGGGNTEDIRKFFWGWKSQHTISNETNLERTSTNLLKEKEVPMMELGIFGVVWGEPDIGFGDTQSHAFYYSGQRLSKEKWSMKGGRMAGMMPGSMPMAAAAPIALGNYSAGEAKLSVAGGVAMDAMERVAEAAPGAEVAPALRSNFADTAAWAAAIQTGADGIAETSFTMPENITGWKIQSWAMGQGVRVAEATSETATKKNLMVRLQAPRFFVEGDEAILSANVQNYLSAAKNVRVVLEVEGLETTATLEQRVDIAAGGEHRVNWLVKAAHEGEAVVRMKALTDVESDAMEMRFPIYVHGMNKMVAFAGSIRGEQTSATVKFDIPEKRREAETRLEVHYSPTLAGAMVDALPYLVSYPYGCTEQTLNRFLPTVITQKVLLDMGLDLATVKNKTVNLNAQELGDPAERVKQWKRFRDPKTGEYQNPVFDKREVEKMANEGLHALTDMQLSDGGWGWFSGYAEQSMPHTTALVVHGMQLAQENGAALVPGVMERGIDWLKNYQAQEIQKIKNWPDKKDPRKEKADNLDAYVYMVLTDGGVENAEMREFLYRDRNDLSVYAKAMFGMGLVKANQREKLAMVMQNIDQFLVRDDENQTAYLNLGNENYWWCWYGSDIEANAYYLKLLARTGQTTDWKAPYLVKYILNNRKNGSYWNSTRDTAVAIEALAEYLKASGEDKPDMTVQVLLDGAVKKEVRITPQDLFSFDNKLEVTGEALTSGSHTVEFKRSGKGPLYFNVYASYFTLEDFITSAGLEVKVQREIYKVIEGQRDVAVAGSHGQSVDQKSEKKDRVLLPNEGAVKSGDQIEIELTIESKNDYEYVVFEDMKAAGFEPVQVQSGYVPNELGAYVEFRDNRVAFFMSTLPRGRHSVTYRMRAETPGRYSALPTRAYAMYAPELRGNSDEMKVRVEE